MLYEKNAHEAMPPASVTKVMTLLLIYEAEKDGKFEWEVFVSRKGSGNEAVPHEEKGARLFQKPKHCAYSRHSPLLPQPQNGCTEGVVF